MKVSDEGKLFQGVLWLNAKVLGFSLGILCGLAIFIATNWLVLKGGSNVGQHLQLLSQFFIGYRVTFLGSLIGFAYGFIVGGLSGVMLAWAYNMVVTLRK